MYELSLARKWFMGLVTFTEPGKLEKEGCIVVSSSIKIEGKSYEVWYRIPEGPVSSANETFLALSLLTAMKTGSTLKISGDVSPKLLGNIPRIQELFHVWDRSYQNIPVEAGEKDALQSTFSDDREVGCFFTGGVDSFYTLLKHRDEITTLIYVNGFDVQMDELLLRTEISQMIRDISNKFQKKLIEIETNLRAFSDNYISWSFFHGAALASIAHLLSPKLKKIYIPASDSYADLFPWGTHPLLDPLWSSEDTEIVHDGGEARRLDKILQISSNDVVLKSLRVCLSSINKSGGVYNCCRCEKCMRTMVGLRIAGVLEKCTTFKRPLNLGGLARTELTTEYLPYYRESLEAVERLGNDPSLAKALRDVINGKYQHGVWKLYRRLLQKLVLVRNWYRASFGK